MSTPTKADMERYARDALQMLQRAKHGHDSLGTLDGSGPVNEWVAIGYATSALRRALGLPNQMPGAPDNSGEQLCEKNTK